MQTGWGRTGGKWFGIEQYGVKPDIIVAAKSLGNGHPVGATVARAAVADSFKGLTIATFGGNPVTMAAAKAVVDAIAADRLMDNAADGGRPPALPARRLQPKSTRRWARCAAWASCRGSSW